jgi:hypothetical protein
MIILAVFKSAAPRLDSRRQAAPQSGPYQGAESEGGDRRRQHRDPGEGKNGELHGFLVSLGLISDMDNII